VRRKEKEQGAKEQRRKGTKLKIVKSEEAKEQKDSRIEGVKGSSGLSCSSNHKP